MKATSFALAAGAMMFVGAAHATDTSVPFILANYVHAMGITGQGVTVAVIDTGVDYWDFGIANDIAPGGTSIINGV